MRYGYLLTKEERIKRDDIIGTTFYYKPTNPKLNYYWNSLKIATMLILSEKVHEMTADMFDNGDKILSEDLLSMSFFGEENDMRKYSSMILKEQSIIAAVSNWEGYFSDISEIILNDDEFIQKIFRDKEKLRKILDEFKLMQDFRNEVFLNRNSTDGLRFGSYLKKNRKLNFQNKDVLRAILRKLYEIDSLIDSNSWKEIYQLIQDRHEIVHNTNNHNITDNYSKDKIERIIKNMSEIISLVDEELFTIDDISTIQLVPILVPSSELNNIIYTDIKINL